MRPRQNCRHFADDIFKGVFLNENVCPLLKISLKFFPIVSTGKITALVQIMAWRRPNDKPLSEPMPVRLLTHTDIYIYIYIYIYVTWPQRVDTYMYGVYNMIRHHMISGNINLSTLQKGLYLRHCTREYPLEKKHLLLNNGEVSDNAFTAVEWKHVGYITWFCFVLFNALLNIVKWTLLLTSFG